MILSEQAQWTDEKADIHHWITDGLRNARARASTCG